MSGGHSSCAAACRLAVLSFVVDVVVGGGAGVGVGVGYEDGDDDDDEEMVVVALEIELEEDDEEGEEGEGEDLGLEAFMAAQSAKDVHERHLVFARNIHNNISQPIPFLCISLLPTSNFRPRPSSMKES